MFCGEYRLARKNLTGGPAVQWPEKGDCRCQTHRWYGGLQMPPMSRLKKQNRVKATASSREGGPDPLAATLKSSKTSPEQNRQLATTGSGMKRWGLRSYFTIKVRRTLMRELRLEKLNRPNVL